MTTTNGLYFRFQCVALYTSGKHRPLAIEVQTTDISDPAPASRSTEELMVIMNQQIFNIDAVENRIMTTTIEAGDKRWTIWGCTPLGEPTFSRVYTVHDIKNRRTFEDVASIYFDDTPHEMCARAAILDMATALAAGGGGAPEPPCA